MIMHIMRPNHSRSLESPRQQILNRIKVVKLPLPKCVITEKVQRARQHSPSIVEPLHRHQQAHPSRLDSLLLDIVPGQGSRLGGHHLIQLVIDIVDHIEPSALIQEGFRDVQEGCAHVVASAKSVDGLVVAEVVLEFGTLYSLCSYVLV